MNDKKREIEEQIKKLECEIEAEEIALAQAGALIKEKDEENAAQDIERKRSEVNRLTGSLKALETQAINDKNVLKFTRMGNVDYEDGLNSRMRTWVFSNNDREPVFVELSIVKIHSAHSDNLKNRFSVGTPVVYVDFIFRKRWEKDNVDPKYATQTDKFVFRSSPKAILHFINEHFGTSFEKIETQSEPIGSENAIRDGSHYPDVETKQEADTIKVEDIDPRIVEWVEATENMFDLHGDFLDGDERLIVLEFPESQNFFHFEEASLINDDVGLELFGYNAITIPENIYKNPELGTELGTINFDEDDEDIFSILDDDEDNEVESSHKMHM